MIHPETGEDSYMCDDCLDEFYSSKIAKFFAERIFRGFCKKYPSLEVTDQADISTITRKILGYFDELGSMLSYQVSTEWTMKMLLEAPSKDIERKRIDMVWIEPPASLFLALEYENKNEAIESDIEKLIASEAELSILYCHPIDRDRIVNVVKSRMKEKYSDKLPLGNQFLLILDPWVSRSTFGTGILEGVLVDRRGEEVGRGKAQVIKEEKSGHRMFVEVSWSQGGTT